MVNPGFNTVLFHLCIFCFIDHVSPKGRMPGSATPQNVYSLKIFIVIVSTFRKIPVGRTTAWTLVCFKF